MSDYGGQLTANFKSFVQCLDTPTTQAMHCRATLVTRSCSCSPRAREGVHACSVTVYVRKQRQNYMKQLEKKLSLLYSLRPEDGITARVSGHFPLDLFPKDMFLPANSPLHFTWSKHFPSTTVICPSTI